MTRGFKEDKGYLRPAMLESSVSNSFFSSRQPLPVTSDVKIPERLFTEEWFDRESKALKQGFEDKRRRIEAEESRRQRDLQVRNTEARASNGASAANYISSLLGSFENTGPVPEKKNNPRQFDTEASFDKRKLWSQRQAKRGANVNTDRERASDPAVLGFKAVLRETKFQSEYGKSKSVGRSQHIGQGLVVSQPKSINVSRFGANVARRYRSDETVRDGSGRIENLQRMTQEQE